MKTKQVTIVRIYLSEAQGGLDALMRRLHDWEKVPGVTVFRGISGFGETGGFATAKFTDMSLNLPVVVEFFDEPAKAQAIVEHLGTFIKPHHMVWWTVQTNE